MHIVWHRTELRTHDQPALHFAAQMALQNGETLLPLVIIDPKIFARPDLTPRRRAWFMENVRALRESYKKLGGNLVVREGEPHQVLDEICAEFSGGKNRVTHMHFVRNYTPYAKERDAGVRKICEKRGIRVLDYPGQYTHEPGEVLNEAGKPYSVFAAFRKKWGTLPKPELFDAPGTLPPFPSVRIGEIPKIASDIPLPDSGESAALARLDWFLGAPEKAYDKTRSRPDLEDATSKLSYRFNIGTLSPRLAQHRATTYKWKFELTWWDFFAGVLDAMPESATQESNLSWRGFPWRDGNAEQIHRWSHGETGYPLVDAGMRELQATGFMHNRVRMACADFFSRHLMIDWRIGEEIFRGLLLCGDRAQNVGNWQWVAGCGLNAKAYFRVSNPLSLSRTADPEAVYIKRWVPELRDASPEEIFTLSSTRKNGYPAPMLDIRQTRARYIETARAHLAKK
jgi:deoxyribodipyrimidine photo-lyase